VAAKDIEAIEVKAKLAQDKLEKCKRTIAALKKATF
jgi:hypothetical protein